MKYYGMERYGETISGFLRLFIPLISFFCLVIVINFTVDTLYEKNLLREKQQHQLRMSLQSLQRDVSGIIRALRYLSSNESLRQYFAERTTALRVRAEDDLANFAHHMDRYDQIRWLDLRGYERLRIDHRDGTTRVVPGNEMQDKSNRYYYKEAIVLPPGEVFVSPLDLNVEHGKLELPHRPMLRFAMPTRDATGKTDGLLVLNYQASILLQNFAATLLNPENELALLNAEGYWLYSSSGEPTWGFMLDRDERLVKRDAQAWREIAGQSSGHVETSRGLYSFTSFDVAAFSKRVDAAGLHDSDVGTSLAPLNPERLILVIHSPRGKLNALNFEHLNHYVLLLVLSFVVLAFLSWRTARTGVEKTRLLDRLKLHAAVMESATNAIMITDPNNQIVSVNNAFTELTGYTAEEVLGKDPSILSSGRHGESYFAEMWFALKERGHWEGELWNRHKNGEFYPEWVSITAVLDHQGELANYIGIFSLLSEQKSTEARLRELANSDPLTGLINRNLFLDRTAQALVNARRGMVKTAVLFLDLDRFKPINDSLGHAMGDSVLREVAQRLQDTVRGSDTVARFGGDEFVILLTGLKDVEEAAVVANKLIASVSEPLEYNGIQCQVGVSVGIAVCPDDAETAETLIKCADEAMYAAKGSGRGKYCFYAEDSARSKKVSE